MKLIKFIQASYLALTLVGFIVMSSVSAPVSAGVIGVDLTVEGSVNYLNDSSYDYSMGYIFTALTNTSVVGLSVYDNAMDGLLIDHQVGLYTSTGVLMASANVSAGTSATLMGFFRVATLNSAISLFAGNQYVVMADRFLGSEAMTYNGLGTVDSRISWDGYRNIQSSTLAFSTSGGAPGPLGDFGGNIVLADVASVSGPTTLALLGLGLFGIGFNRRKNYC